MLHIRGLTYRIGGRLLIDDASVAVPAGHKVGLVGRNGTGKSTLLRIILGELPPEAGSVSIPSRARIGTVAQEAPGGETSLLDTVLAGDIERSALLTEAETAEDPHRIAEIQTRLVDIDAHSAPARAAAILSGLGFAAPLHTAPCSVLSGGWRMRVALAAALFGAPDILLLDEPTNYLDLEGSIWLENFIQTYPYTIVIASHDRDFLNNAVNAILHLDRGKLVLYQGNYESFDRQRREKQALQGKLRKKQEEQRRHMMAFVDRFRYKASKARQAQSRLKALARLQPIAELVEDHVAPFSFPNPERPLAPPLVRWERASVGYSPGHDVLRGITLRLDPDDRVALLGANGNGKSTFAKLLCGKLAVSGGEMQHHQKLKVGYFAQHQLDELDADRTPYEYICSLMPDSPESRRRARLGAAGFGASIADSKCVTLSGGEKARLLFMLAAFDAPHLLILDEPTNHLDVDSREALIMAINDFEGAVILISHDQHIIETCADRLWLVADGTVRPFDGDMEDYRRLILDGGAVPSQAPKTQKTMPPKAKARPANTPAQLRKRIAEIEEVIRRLEDKVQVLDRALEDPRLYAEEPHKAADFVTLRSKLSNELSAAENEWLDVQHQIEAAGVA
jgi:ATP-binding cassette subfamily F protein 3